MDQVRSDHMLLLSSGQWAVHLATETCSTGIFKIGIKGRKEGRKEKGIYVGIVERPVTNRGDCRA